MAFEPRQPDFASEGLAIWKAVIGEGKNKGKTYLKVKIHKGTTLNIFPVEKKKE